MVPARALDRGVSSKINCSPESNTNNFSVAEVTLSCIDYILEAPHAFSFRACRLRLAAPGLPQYIASLDAENARMLAEIQGLSVGGGAAGGLGIAGLGSDLNTAPSSLFSGPGAVAGRRAMGYLGPGLQGNQSGMDGGVVAAAAGQGVGDGGSSTVGQKQGGATGERGVGAEWDSTVLGGVEGGEPLSPRNREYRRKMVEMDAEHKVRGSIRLVGSGMREGGPVGIDDTR